MIASLLLLTVGCGGLSNPNDTAAPAVDASVSDAAADAGYDVTDIDDDQRTDGEGDPLLMVQGGVLSSSGADLPASPFMCTDESIRQYTAISVLAGYGLGGDNDWYAESNEAYRLYIEGREYDCTRLFDNEDVFRGGHRSSSEDCDEDMDADEDGFQCWADFTNNARVDSYVAKVTYIDENGDEQTAYNAFWAVVDEVLYSAVSSNGSTGENSETTTGLHRVGNLPLLVDVPADHDEYVKALGYEWGLGE